MRCHHQNSFARLVTIPGSARGGRFTFAPSLNSPATAAASFQLRAAYEKVTACYRHGNSPIGAFSSGTVSPWHRGFAHMAGHACGDGGYRVARSADRSTKDAHI